MTFRLDYAKFSYKKRMGTLLHFPVFSAQYVQGILNRIGNTFKRYLKVERACLKGSEYNSFEIL